MNGKKITDSIHESLAGYTKKGESKHNRILFKRQLITFDIRQITFSTTN